VNEYKVKRETLPIVCFAGCDWWYHNRGLFCPQVMTRLAKDYTVLFVNSLGMRVPSLKRDRHAVKKIIRKLRSTSLFLRKANNGMYVLSPLLLPFFGNYVGRRLNALCVSSQVKLAMTLLGFRRPIFYIGCPPALEVVEKLGRKYLIYERTDLFEEMPEANKSYVASLDDKLTKLADLVLYVNNALWKQGMNKNKNSLLVGHGVDFDLFADALKSKYMPEEMAQMSQMITDVTIIINPTGETQTIGKWNCTGYDVEMVTWRGVVVKAGTPPEIVEKIRAAFAKSMEHKIYKNYLEDNSMGPESILIGADWDAFLDTKWPIWKQVMEDLGYVKK